MVACGDPSGTAERVWNVSVACRHAAEGRRLATLAGCYLWRGGHARALRPPGSRAPSRGQRFPLRHAARQFDWLLLPRLDRPVHHESHGAACGLAHGHHCRLLWRLHDFLQLWLGNGQMLEDGEWLGATAYVGASVLAGLLLSVAGIRLANKF